MSIREYWKRLSDEELEEFLHVNGIEIPDNREDLLHDVDKLYRGLIKVGIILTESVAKLEYDYIRVIMKIDDRIQASISYELEYDDVLKLCSTNLEFQRLCDDLKFWKLYLSKRTELDLNFFTSFDEDEMDNLKREYGKYERTGNFKYLIDYRDIVNYLFLGEFEKYEIGTKYVFTKSYIKYGGLPFIRNMILSGLIPEDKVKFFYDVIRSENLELIKYVIEEFDTQGSFLSDVSYLRVINIAAFTGNLDLVVYLIEKFNIISVNEGTLSGAALSGNLDLVVYLIEKFNMIPEKRTLENAIKSGNLDMVVYFYEVFNLIPNVYRFSDAIESGNLDLVLYFIEKYEFPFDRKYDFYRAIRTGNLDMVNYFIEEFDIKHVDGLVFVYAAESGNLDLFKYFESKFPEINPNIRVETAIKSGNLNILRYTVEKFGLVPNERNFFNVVLKEDLELFKYLAEKFKDKLNILFLRHVRESSNFQLINYIRNIEYSN